MNVVKNKEPLITVGLVTTAVSAVLVFLKEFGVDITDGQQEAIRNLVGVMFPLIMAIIGRQFVYSPQTTQEKVDAAAETGVTEKIV